MVSSSVLGTRFYCVQIRFGDSYREQVCSCESRDFYHVKQLAVQVARWLGRGWASVLPEGVLELPEALRELGIDPARCVVEVVRLREVAPGLYDTDGEVLCVVIDCAPDADDDELEDTVLASGEAVNESPGAARGRVKG